MIIVNGLPKSGTHAAMAWLTQLGFRRHPGTLLLGCRGLYVEGGSLEHLPKRAQGMFILAHVPTTVIPWGHVITVMRDPRNVLVSYTRHRLARDGKRVALWEAIDSFWGEPFVPLARAYLGWRERSVVLRYEDMPPDAVGDGRAIYAGQGRDWNTRTGNPSDWRQVWCDRTEKAWVAADGPALVADSGYHDSMW